MPDNTIPAELDGLVPQIGSIWVWEPDNPKARSTERVVHTMWDGDEVWVESERVEIGFGGEPVRTLGRVQNTLARWMQACVLQFPAEHAAEQGESGDPGLERVESCDLLPPASIGWGGPWTRQWACARPAGHSGEHRSAAGFHWPAQWPEPAEQPPAKGVPEKGPLEKGLLEHIIPEALLKRASESTPSEQAPAGGGPVEGGLEQGPACCCYFLPVPEQCQPCTDANADPHGHTYRHACVGPLPPLDTHTETGAPRRGTCRARYHGTDPALYDADCTLPFNHDGSHMVMQPDGPRMWLACSSLGGILGGPMYRCLLGYGHTGSHSTTSFTWDRSPTDPDPERGIAAQAAMDAAYRAATTPQDLHRIEERVTRTEAMLALHGWLGRRHHQATSAISAVSPTYPTAPPEAPQDRPTTDPYCPTCNNPLQPIIGGPTNHSHLWHCPTCEHEYTTTPPTRHPLVTTTPLDPGPSLTHTTDLGDDSDGDTEGYDGGYTTPLGP